MKSQIKILLVAAIVSTTTATSCSGNKNAGASDCRSQNAESAVDLRGKWSLRDIVFRDSAYVRIAEESSGRQQYITFDDSTYFIQTNCNSISGTYNVKGDSITFSDGTMTEKACDNMATEEALRIILPEIVKAVVYNDSVLRLECREPSEYALLYKVAD